MIVVKVEMWPHGDQGRAREIGRLEIANVGGDLAVGEYRVELLPGRDRWGRESGRVEHVRGHDRRLSAWSLVSKALAAVGFM